MCQFKEHIFPFVRSRKVTMVNFQAILHSPHFFNEKSTSLLNVSMATPHRKVDHTIFQDHGNGVMRYQCDLHADMNGDVGRPIDDAPRILGEEVEVKPQETADVSVEFPVRKVTIE
jgi:hypothetical protein